MNALDGGEEVVGMLDHEGTNGLKGFREFLELTVLKSALAKPLHHL